jgi:hypothetical protein
MSLKVNKLKRAFNGFFCLFMKVFTLLSCQFMDNLVFEKIKERRQRHMEGNHTILLFISILILIFFLFFEYFY